MPERAVREASPSPAPCASSPIPRARGEGRGEGQKLAPTVAYAAAPHPNPLPMPEEAWGEGMISPPRPLLLLPRPEPADVVALIPEGPPRQFRWRGVLHQVGAGARPGAHRAGMVAPHASEDERDYYMVEDTERPPLLALPRRPLRTRSETHAAVVRARGVRMTAFAELVAATNFSFLRGARMRTRWSGRQPSWGLPPSASPTATRWPASCARIRRPRSTTSGCWSARGSSPPTASRRSAIRPTAPPTAGCAAC